MCSSNIPINKICKWIDEILENCIHSQAKNILRQIITLIAGLDPEPMRKYWSILKELKENRPDFTSFYEQLSVTAAENTLTKTKLERLNREGRRIFRDEFYPIWDRVRNSAKPWESFCLELRGCYWTTKWVRGV